MRVLQPGPGELRTSFRDLEGLAPLLRIPRRLGPRLAELKRLSEPGVSLVLAERADGVIVGIFDGEEALRDLRFSADGEVACGTSEPPRFLATIEELPPF